MLEFNVRGQRLYRIDSFEPAEKSVGYLKAQFHTSEPEDLPAQWGFLWSTDPVKALPFVAISTSPYMTGDCCTENGITYRSTIDNNVWAPSAYPAGWEKVEEEVK